MSIFLSVTTFIAAAYSRQTHSSPFDDEKTSYDLNVLNTHPICEAASFASQMQDSFRCSSVITRIITLKNDQTLPPGFQKIYSPEVSTKPRLKKNAIQPLLFGSKQCPAYFDTKKEYVGDDAIITPDIKKPIKLFVDWYRGRKHTPPHDQLKCGCCYAMAVVGALEEVYAIKTNERVRFSPAELIECHNCKLEDACQGGNSRRVLRYVKSNGISLLSDYPYFSEDSGCKSDKVPSGKKYHIDRYIHFNNTMPSVLRAMEEGPLIVGLSGHQAYKDHRQKYFDAHKCTGDDSHAMLLLAYNITVPSQSLMILKNSWGTGWGYKGYLYLRFVYSPSDPWGPCNIGVDRTFTVKMSQWIKLQAQKIKAQVKLPSKKVINKVEPAKSSLPKTVKIIVEPQKSPAVKNHAKKKNR